MNTKIRKGTIGAILDEYEIAVSDLKNTIKKISDVDLARVVDPKTRDSNCRTIQGVLSHVVICGYYSAIRIMRSKYPSENPDEKFPFPKLVKLNKISEYNKALDEMFAFTEKSLIKLKGSEMRTLNPDKMIKTGWGWYDYEQLLETSIMHVYRHRRQIKKFILILKESNNISDARN